MVPSDTLAGDDDVESEVLERVLQKQLKEVLWKTVDSLPDDQPDMIRKRYVCNMTLEEIGASCNTGVWEARRDIDKGLKTLRTTKRKFLRPYLEEYIETSAYHGNSVSGFNRTWTSSTERVALKLTEMDGLPDEKSI